MPNSSCPNQKTTWERRTRIADRPNIPVKFWSIIKNFIGRDVTKVSLPISVHEPISLLQRISEVFNYSELLDQAAKCEDLCEQISYLAAFTAAGYSLSDCRLTKPFNPLLGETFEFDRRDDLGWRLIAEQVSHSPDISILHCASKDWTCHIEFQLKPSFKGNSIEFKPIGTIFMEFNRTESKYIWTKQVITKLCNLIIGHTHIDNYGKMEIIGEKSAKEISCIMDFIEENTTDGYAKIDGIVNDNEKIKFLLKGRWNSEITMEDYKSDKLLEKNKVLWTRIPQPEGSEKYYNFTEFTCQLNEPDPCVAPTDTRFRPDIRLMEIGDWDEAAKKKDDLNGKQRIRAKTRKEPYEPVWFKHVNKEDNKLHRYVFGEEYWECKETRNWFDCPNIFL